MRIRIIPAWAGNTAAYFRPHGTRPDHPRVGGEHSFCKVLKYQTK